MLVRENALMSEWAHYWRAPEHAVEAMHAHFERHVYHRHSHQTYSFGLTETGAQTFTCRGARHTSAAGMVMAFNPDDPHDGHAATARGFTYRMVHLGADVVTDVLVDWAQRPVGRPLFAEPVIDDPELAAELRRLHVALCRGSQLARDEAVAGAIRALVRRCATRRPGVPDRPVPSGVRLARDLLHASVADDIRIDDLAQAAGCSRYALHRGFRKAYGLAPSDYQRQLRLRTARELLAAGWSAAHTAAAVGFADQSHLTRWFTRHYGITPGVFARPNR